MEKSAEKSRNRKLSLAWFTTHMGKLARPKWNVITGVATIRWMVEFWDGIAICTSQ